MKIFMEGGGAKMLLVFFFEQTLGGYFLTTIQLLNIYKWFFPLLSMMSIQLWTVLPSLITKLIVLPSCLIKNSIQKLTYND